MNTAMLHKLELEHELEDARESAYLRQVNFYRRSLFENFSGVMSGLSLGTCTSILSP